MELDSLRSQLNQMIQAGHPVFTSGNMIILPEEAEDYFTPDERDKISDYIRSQMTVNTPLLSAEPDEFTL